MAKPYSPKELQAIAAKAAAMPLAPGGTIAPTTPPRPPPQPSAKKQPAAKKASARPRGTVQMLQATAKTMPQD